jgi:hypothetical protein
MTVQRLMIWLRTPTAFVVLFFTVLALMAALLLLVDYQSALCSGGASSVVEDGRILDCD